MFGLIQLWKVGLCIVPDLLFLCFFVELSSDMGDSEDEYDRKRRDKFRGERGSGAGGGGGAGGDNYRGPDRRDDRGRGRDDWADR